MMDSGIVDVQVEQENMPNIQNYETKVDNDYDDKNDEKVYHGSKDVKKNGNGDKNNMNKKKKMKRKKKTTKSKIRGLCLKTGY